MFAGSVLEALVSRMRFVSSYYSRRLRIVGLSTALANASDVANWMGVGVVGLFNFKHAVRPVPCTVHVQGTLSFLCNFITLNQLPSEKPAPDALKSG